MKALPAVASGEWRVASAKQKREALCLCAVRATNSEQCGCAATDYRVQGRISFGVYAVDLLSRWRALRGFRKTLEDDHD